MKPKTSGATVTRGRIRRPSAAASNQPINHKGASSFSTSWRRQIPLLLAILFTASVTFIVLSQTNSFNEHESSIQVGSTVLRGSSDKSNTSPTLVASTRLPMQMEDKVKQQITQRNSNEKTATTGAAANNIIPDSKYAYVTLLSGIDSSYRYRGFLYNTIIMRNQLKDLGSTADFIAMIGFGHQEKNLSIFDDDLNLLRRQGVKLYYLPRYVDDHQRLSFAEMALLKISPWSFTQYQRVQYFDGDVMPTENMDCFFQLKQNTFTVGAASPLNSGWYLAVPNLDDYHYMHDKALWRLAKDWDQQNGWQEAIPPGKLWYRGGDKPVELWDFNGADMDQGLFTHRFVLNEGRAMLIDTDTKNVRVFTSGLLHHPDSQIHTKEALACCHGKDPVRHFAHFTGRDKPWLMDLASLEDIPKNSKVLMWAHELDKLNLPINSKNIASLGLSSPLGYFNANFPKGGFQVKKRKAVSVSKKGE